ncbi:MAG: DUF3102 domain-containing protein [Cyanophyceae cyanobacterium]
MNDLIQSQHFDYNALAQETRGVVQQRTIEIKNILRRTAQDIVNVGQKLTEVKEQLGHGNFRNWLLAEFELSLSAATKFMQVYEQFKSVNFKNLDIAVSALYLLAAPSTPPEARHKALARAHQGESITYSKAKTIVGYYKKATANKVFMAGSARESPIQEKPLQTIEVSVMETNARQVPIRPSANTRFRVRIADVGSIIKLYRADELEHSSQLTVGTPVRILAGRFSGRTATIQEILDETDTRQDDPSTANQSSDVSVSNSEPQASTTEEAPSIEVNYASVRMAFTGSPEDLIRFFERMRSDSAFAEEVFRQTKRLTEAEQGRGENPSYAR